MLDIALNTFSERDSSKSTLVNNIATFYLQSVHKGKRSAYTRLVEHIKINPTELTHFGLTENVDENDDSDSRYILILYGSRRRTCMTQDQLKYTLASTTDKSLVHLTPSKDSFRQRVLRARY